MFTLRARAPGALHSWLSSERTHILVRFQYSSISSRQPTASPSPSPRVHRSSTVHCTLYTVHTLQFSTCASGRVCLAIERHAALCGALSSPPLSSERARSLCAPRAPLGARARARPPLRQSRARIVRSSAVERRSSAPAPFEFRVLTAHSLCF